MRDSVLHGTRLLRDTGVAAVTVALVVCGSARSAQNTENSPPLRPAQTLHAALAPGEHRHYRVPLPSGFSAVVSVRQDDAMLKVGLSQAGAAASTPMTTQAGHEAMLQFHLDGSQAEQWEIDIAAAKPERAASFRIELAPPRATTTADRAAVVAEHAFAAAERIRLAAGGVEPGRQPADIDAARADYADAIRHWHAARDDCSALRARVGLARFELALARYPQAQAAAEAGLGECDGADLAIAADRAAALRTLAAALGYQGDFEASASAGERALALYRRTGDRRFEGVVLGNLSAVYRSLGETRKAADTAQTALDIALATGDAQGIEFSRDNLADSYVARGEFGRALAVYRQILAQLRETPYPLTEGLVWNELGGLYRRMGERDAAADAWAHAREIWASSGNRSGMAETWIASGDAALDDGAVATAAAAFTRALDVARDAHLQSPELHALRGLGRAAAANGDSARSRQDLNAALALAQRIGDDAGEIATEQALGDVDAGVSAWADARGHYERALTNALHDADASAEAAATASLARIDVDEDRLDAAQRRASRALAIIETQRAGIADPDLRTGFFASQRQYYALMIDIEMGLDARDPGRGHRERALEAAERARARNLQDTLAERAINIDTGVDPALLASEQRAADAQRRLAYRSARSAGRGTRQKAALQRETDTAQRQLDEARGRIRIASPRYAAIAQPAPLRIADVQTSLLDDDAVIVEYWLGPTRSYLWVIDRQSVRSFILPARAEIAHAAHALRASTTARASEEVTLSIERRVERETGDDAATWRMAGNLAEQIVPTELRALTRKRWAIVADGELDSVPFALLLQAQTEEPPPALVRLPSIGALRGLRAEPVVQPPATALALVADPVFARDDPRLVASTGLPIATAQAHAADDPAALALPRLPNAVLEADDIARLAGGRPLRRWFGFDADRSALLNVDWSSFAIVHFATHAQVDVERPELSGIALSMVDRTGRAEDGWLRTDDLYTLEMPSDLVVLGVCDAARGKSIEGEGVQSLATAFFHAGTRHVLGSLWAVDDRASAVFMHAFYTALLHDDQRPPQALARAQQQMRDAPRWRAPYYWSGYIVQGDWR